MKKLILFVALLVSAHLLWAQSETSKIKLNENSIVKDESGSVFPYAIWKKLLSTGQFAVKLMPSTDNSVEFQLYKLTEEQIAANKQRRFEAASKSSMPKQSDAFQVGDKFRFEKLKDLNGVKYDFKNDTGKVVVFNFWFINCPPCKREIPELNELVEKYKANTEVKFIAIALDDSYSLKDFLKLSPFHYNIIPDGGYYSQKYGVKAYPTHVIVGKDGIIKFSTVGLASNTIYWVDKTIKEQL